MEKQDTGGNPMVAFAHLPEKLKDTRSFFVVRQEEFESGASRVNWPIKRAAHEVSVGTYRQSRCYTAKCRTINLEREKRRSEFIPSENVAKRRIC